MASQPTLAATLAETAPALAPAEPASASDVRVLVQEEGRAARNLLVFNVLVDNKSPSSVLRSARRQPAASPRAGRPEPQERLPARAAAASAARKRGRARSVSAGRGSAKDLHARYWTFLFENLRRAVDEIYQTCETDDSVLECKETIMILERCTQDFRNLIEWLKIKWEYDHTPKPQRPASVAWEIRKTSPGKLPLALVEKRLIGDHSRKQLAFEERHSRPDSVSSGSMRPEPDAAVGRYLEQALRSAMETQEIPGDATSQPPPPPPPPPEQEREEGSAAKLVRMSPPPPAPQQQQAAWQPGEMALEAAQKPTRARTAARPRGGRTAAPGGAAGRTRSGVSPRGGGGRGAVTRPVTAAAAAVGGAGGRAEQKTFTRQGQSQTAGRGTSTIITTTTSSTTSSSGISRPERPGLASRRTARGALRAAGPPPVVRSATVGRATIAAAARSAAGQTRGTAGLLQRSATVCSSEQRPAPAQLYSSCVKSRSNSSLSSTASSSGHSWADRVRGVAATGPAAAPAAPAAPAASAASTAATAPAAAAAPAPPADDDGGGWETVKSRTRSRLSSLNQAQGRAPLQRKGSAEAACGGGRPYSARARFHQPTSAVSLPSLTPSAGAERAERRPSGVSERAVRGAARRATAGRGAARSAPPPPPGLPAQGDSHALRRSRERVPTQRPAVGDGVEEKGAAAAAQTVMKEERRSREPVVQRGSEVGVGDSTLPSDASHCREDSSASSSVTLEAATSTADPATTDTITAPAATINATTTASTDATTATSATVTTEATTTYSNTATTTASTALSISIPGGPAPSTTASPPAPPTDAPGPAAGSPLTPCDLTSPTPTPRDLTSPELDEDSVDEEMVQAERALESAIVEERHLEQQLAETESCEIEVDTETDGESTSIDTECEGDGGPPAPPSRSLIEDQYAPELENLSWGDRMDLLEELEDLSSRTPGRGLQMHAKLSSPSRKKALSETIRLHHERQQKASRTRRTLMDQKTQKLSEISIKIEEVRQQKEQLLEQRRLMLERKMARAEEKRRKHLQDIVRRAHDEEEKAKEIAFINELEANNKRHEFYSQIQTQEARLAGIQEERQRRLEEKAAKEAAVEGKRRALEQERQVKLEELKQKRKERLERINREQRDKEKERLEMAREKQRDRDERISALHAAQQATAEELQRRIQQKQEESARRHEENMVQIRQKALELSVRSAAAGGDDTAAQLAPYETKKMCTLCNVLIGSEVYLLTHLRGRQHQEAVRAAAGADLAGEELLLYNLRHITDAAPHHIISMTFDKERHKTLRKRCKKIKARMVARQQEYARGSRTRPVPVESPHRAKLAKCVKELNKVLSGQGRGPWPNAAVSALDRTLGEVMRILDKGVAADQLALCAAGGLQVLSDVIALIQEELARDVEIVPARTVSNVSRTLAAACRHSSDNCLHMINSNMVGGALELLMTRLTRLSSTCAASGGVRCDPGAAALMQLTSALLAALTSADLSHQRWGLLQDVCSYLVCVGTVDKISTFFSCVQGGPDSEPHLADFLTQSLRLLRAMAALLTARHPQSTQSKEPLDRTGLIATLQVTQLCGIVSLLYGTLLRHHQPAQRRTTPPPPLDQATLLLAAEALSALLQLAQLDLHMFQMCLGFEGHSVEFRHVTSYLLWYCSHHEQPSLLRLVIQTTGYFAARCYDNQMVIQKGNMPTVLQQLLTLPFAHFSDPALTAVLFPTLLACCLDNAQTRAILEQELSFQILEDFMKQESSRSCHLVRVLLSADEESGSVRSGSVASSS